MNHKSTFTPTTIATFNCEAGKQQSLLWDPKTPGLGLRVTASGSRAYIFETRLHGKTLRLTIGDVRTWALPDAQKEARHYKALTDQGIDPRQQKAEQRRQAEAVQVEAQRQAVTLRDVWPLYLAARQAKWSSRHYLDHVRLATAGGDAKKRGKGKRAAGPLASLLSVRLADLTGARIAQWLDAETATRPTSAAQSFRLLRAFLRWAEDTPAYRGLVPAEAYRARGVRDALPKSRSKEGDCLQREQLRDWFSAVRKLPNPVMRTYLQALLLTGARREEMANLRWEDVDFQWRSLTIRDKTEGTRVIPLPPYLASLLLELKRINDTPPPPALQKRRARQREWHPSEWVFFSKAAANGRMQEPRIAHNRALAVAGLPHVTLHGLRRSFGTLCEWVEMPAGISAQIMGHKPSALAEKHYRRRPLDLLRKWHDSIEAWVLEQAGIPFKPATPALRVVGSE